ncbi:FUSC family protein [Synechococcus sp. PCC 6312]|uniref:FUSC family protein n=1 Tax=Synechococcus sp. (strain ATCC 27167 / PCC 6312) TaxID=195253 RepID=UPI00029F1FA8|nr:FUSC family protein [Synechococcus sp. PCC 6312]AFY60903.1 putative membrane protein [Synechococcus sp. PCC 6312]
MWIFAQLRQRWQLDPRLLRQGAITAIAVIVPLMLQIMTGAVEWNWAAWGACYVGIGDPGGAYRRRAITLLAIALAGGLSIGVGILISGVLGLTLFLMFIWGFSCGFLDAFGKEGNLAGVLIGCCFLFAIHASDHSWANAVSSGGAYALGGLWATCLALLAWPLQPELPFRQSVAQVLRGVTHYLQAGVQTPPDLLQFQAITLENRQRILNAQTILTQIHLPKRPKTAAQIQKHQKVTYLATLLKLSEQLYLAILMLTEILQRQRSNLFQSLWSDIYQDINQLILNLNQITEQVEQVNHHLEQFDLTAKIEKLDQKFEQQKLITFQGADQSTAYDESLELNYALLSLKQIAHNLNQIYNVFTGTITPDSNDLVRQFEPTLMWWKVLKSHFTLDSVIFRHGLRIAIGTTLVVAIYNAWNLPYGYWMALTVLVILKPHYSDASKRGGQRVLGSVGGALGAILLVSYVQNPYILMLSMILLIVLMVGFLPVNYFVFVLLYTPIVIIMDSIDNPFTAGLADSWILGELRLLNTLIGACVAFAVNYIVLPQWEPKRLSSQLAELLTTLSRLLAMVLTGYQDNQSISTQDLLAIQQQTRLKLSNIHQAWQRFLNEPHSSPQEIQLVEQLLHYSQRLFIALSLLGNHLLQFQNQFSMPNLTMITNQLTAILGNLIAALLSDVPLIPFPQELIQELAALETDLGQLRQQRIRELKQQQLETPTRQAIIDDTLIVEQLQIMTRSLQALHNILQPLLLTLPRPKPQRKE